MIFRQIRDLFKETFIGWNRNDAMLHAAALAYYTVFSLAPLLVISVSIAARVFNQDMVEWKIVTGVEKRAGEEAATFVNDIIVNSENLLSSRVATGVSLLILVYGASSVFLQLQYSLNAMWNLVPRADTVRQSLMTIIKSRLVSAGIVLGIGFVFAGSLLLNAMWSALPEDFPQNLFSSLRILLPLMRFWASPLLFMVAFAAIFKWLPRARIRWRDVWPGAALTGILFWVGNYLIGLYLSHSAIESIYGAAASAIVVLIWVYYSAWILLFGAKFTHVYADKHGALIAPYQDMMFRTDPYAILPPADPEHPSAHGANR